MTPEQRRMARHALGLPNVRNRSYRNRYYTGLCSDRDESWRELVRQGLATRWRAGGAVVGFSLTEAGAKAVLEPGESLCHEDFPGK